MKVKIEGLSKSFVQGKKTINILDNAELEIKVGEVVALLGKSGSGKTTMLSLLSGLDKPDKGKILIDGEDISQYGEEQLCHYRANKLGIVFQQFHLVPHLTALENVKLTLEIKNNDDDTKAKEWLGLVGLQDRFDHFPSMMSGGEQQRVAMARALVGDPSLLLADEPTGNLDSETGKHIIETLFNIVKKNKTTMILVTHDEELALKADRIVRLSGGKCL